MNATLSINLSHLTHNYNYLKSKTAKHIKLLAVVKALAYGSDAVIIAKHLEYIGVDYLGVAYAAEGVALRKSGIQIPILVLHPQPDNFALCTSYNLEPSLYSKRTLEAFLFHLKSLNLLNYPIHLKFNSGLNRLGFNLSDLEYLAETIKNSSLEIKGLFSHLAASEDLNEKEFTLNQIDSFKKFSKQFINKTNTNPILHQSNTSGILNFSEGHFDMVRTGIGLYGFGNDATYDSNLKPVASLTANISQIHEIKAGQSLGYNRGFIAKTYTKTATITIGHADGIDRIYGHGKGYVIINNQKAPILGNVCMDMLMVNVTGIECEEGQEVILFNEQFPAHQLAENVGTISYELITGIGPRVKRIIE